MKRSFVLSMICLYVVATIGLAFNLHYCGGKIAKVSFIGSEKNCEGKPVAKEASDCCKDQKVEYKVKADQKAANQVKSPDMPPAFALVTNFFEEILPVFSATFEDAFADRAPPDLPRKLNILHCIFRL
ncbi:MAG: hypothetical protein INR69_24470 [Mucilaginibacter polytrichastri]|nr:hypothetical protein [Mucilaginibacter polytrichastri]